MEINIKMIWELIHVFVTGTEDILVMLTDMLINWLKKKIVFQLLYKYAAERDILTIFGRPTDGLLDRHSGTRLPNRGRVALIFLLSKSELNPNEAQHKV
jgi:hypothetical protein